MKSRHFQKRVSQRAIRDDLVDLVQQYGTTLHDGRVRLDRKGIRRVLQTLDPFRKRLIDAEGKGGAVVVIGENNVYITAYKLGR